MKKVLLLGLLKYQIFRYMIGGDAVCLPRRVGRVSALLANGLACGDDSSEKERSIRQLIGKSGCFLNWNFEAAVSAGHVSDDRIQGVSGWELRKESGSLLLRYSKNSRVQHLHSGYALRAVLKARKRPFTTNFKNQINRPGKSFA